MTGRMLAGTPLAHERRGVPAVAAGVSFALHAALLGAVIHLPGGRAPVRPKLIAARNVLAVSIERPSPPRPHMAPKARTHAMDKVPAAAHSAYPEHPRSIPAPDPAEPLPEPAPVEPARPVPPRPAPPVSETRPAASVPRMSAPGGVQAARVIPGEAKPRYPAGCRDGAHHAGGCEGAGRYEVELDGTGRILSARVVRSAGCRELDRSAVRFLLRRARFAPGEMDGVPVPWKGAFVIRFRLEDAKARGPVGRDVR